MLAPFGFLGGVGIDAQAQAHFDRVIADGGLVPSGLSGVNSFFTTVKAIYGTSDITTAISVGLDAQVLGYKLGAGAGTTAGQAAQKLYSCSGASGDVVQTTAASQPLLLVHEGANYWFSPFVANNFCSAPNISIPTNSGLELDLQMNLTSGNIAESGFGWFFSHDNGGGVRPLFIGLGAANTIRVFWNNFTYSANSTAAISSPFNGWLRLKLESIGLNMVVTFSTSLDGITFTQLGLQITVAAAANTVLTSSTLVYTNSNNGSNTSSGKYLRAIYKDANGITRADFNPNQYNAATSQTQWTSSTGEVWTINTGTAATGYKGVLVDRSITMFDGIDDQLLSGTIAAYQYITSNVSARTYNMVSSSTIITGTNDSHAIFNNGGTMSAYNQSVLSFGVGLSNNLRNLQANFNGGSSETFTNNILGNTGNTGAFTATQVRLGNNPVGPFTNCLINTAITTIAVMTNTQKNAMYNYIRSINNNAF